MERERRELEVTALAARVDRYGGAMAQIDHTDSMARWRTLKNTLEQAAPPADPALDPVRALLLARWRGTVARVVLHMGDARLQERRDDLLALIEQARELLGDARPLTLAEVGVRAVGKPHSDPTPEEQAELVEVVMRARQDPVEPADDELWVAYARALELTLAPEAHAPLHAEDLLTPTYEAGSVPFQVAETLERAHRPAFHQALTEAWEGAQRREDRAAASRAARLADAHALALAALAPRCSTATATQRPTGKEAALTAALLRGDLGAARDRLTRAYEGERLGRLPRATFAAEVALLAGELGRVETHLADARRELEAAAQASPEDAALVSYLEAAWWLARGENERAHAAALQGAGQSPPPWLPWRSAEETERALRGEPDPRAWLASGR